MPIIAKLAGSGAGATHVPVLMQLTVPTLRATVSGVPVRGSHRRIWRRSARQATQRLRTRPTPTTVTIVSGPDSKQARCVAASEDAAQ
jgi:hypothetical protein